VKINFGGRGANPQIRMPGVERISGFLKCLSLLNSKMVLVAPPLSLPVQTIAIYPSCCFLHATDHSKALNSLSQNTRNFLVTSPFRVIIHQVVIGRLIYIECISGCISVFKSPFVTLSFAKSTFPSSFLHSETTTALSFSVSS
jgi:hypothetical protein